MVPIRGTFNEPAVSNSGVSIVGRVPRNVRTALALVTLGVAWWAGNEAWVSTRIRVPLYLPISVAKGHVRTPSFHVNLKSWYDISIQAQLGLQPDAGQCGTLFHCYADTRSITATWSLSNGKQAVAEGRSRIGGAGRWLGTFFAPQGDYVLDVDFLADGAALQSEAPHLLVELGDSGAALDSQLTLAFRMLLLLLAASVYVVVLPAVARRRERDIGVAREFSLTERGQQLKPSGSIDIAKLRALRRVLPKVGFEDRGGKMFSAAATWARLAFLIFIPLLAVIMMNRGPTPMGLKVLLKQVNCPHQDPVRVRVSGNQSEDPRLYLNSRLTSSKDFEARLLTEIARRPPGCAIYVEGGPDLEFKSVSRAIDVIHGLHVGVVLAPAIKERPALTLDSPRNLKNQSPATRNPQALNQ